MNRRDVAWRASGALLTAGACLLGQTAGTEALAAACVPFAFLGLPLVIYGKRVPQVFRAERRGHHHTATAIHAARIRRRGQNSDGFGY